MLLHAVELLILSLFVIPASTTFHCLFCFYSGITAIMMFSTLYYKANLLFGMVFLFIALVMSVKLFWELYPDSKMIPLAIKSVILTAFIIFGIQCFAWNRYRKEYNHVVELINEAKAAQKPEVKVPAFTQFAIKTPLGNIYPVYLQRTPVFYTGMAEYYQSPPIVPPDFVTNR